jgi:hypothetical protein
VDHRAGRPVGAADPSGAENVTFRRDKLEVRHGESLELLALGKTGAPREPLRLSPMHAAPTSHMVAVGPWSRPMTPGARLLGSPQL